MEHIHFRAVWMPKVKMFSIKFQILGIEGSSPMFWEVPPENFLKMVHYAELQLLTLDGQNRMNKDHFHMEFVDRHGDDVEINHEGSGRAVFSQMTTYLRQVYDAWKASNL